MKEKPLFVTMDYYLKTVEYKIRKHDFYRNSKLKSFCNMTQSELQQVKGANKLSSFEVPRMREEKQD